MTESILLSESDGVATITLHRPDRLNAFADDMRERLSQALDRVAMSGARALVLTGAGRAFCAGGDVRHMVALKDRDAEFDELRPLLEAGGMVVTRLAALPIPTIAAVNGVAAGAGLNLALACDLRFAAESATFGETFIRIGLHPDWGGSYFLPRRVGLSRALELCWSGESITAHDALAIGLVDRVVQDDRVVPESLAFAERLASAPQASVRAIKRTLRASAHRSLEQCLAAEAAVQEECWSSADVGEGLRAFVEKRPPVFGADPVATGGRARFE